MPSPLLDVAGAVPADPPDDGVAAHYGDPLREQRTLSEHAAVVDRSNRGVVTVTGPDRLSWLHSLTSQHLTGLAPWQSTQALVLSPHGHVEHHLVVTDDGETTWIDVEPGAASPLVAYLDSMRFMLRVEVADVTPRWAVLTVAGAQAAPFDDGPVALGGFARRMPWGSDLVVARERLTQVVERLGLPLAGVTALEALRVEAHRPRLGRETDHRTIPHEVGWLDTAVHLDKGCYRGQETVARVHNLGRPPRRLVLLHLDGTEEQLPAPGTPVELDGRPVGFLGTAVHHWEMGPVALAVVKRQTPDDAELAVAGMAAKAERVVDA